MSAAMIAVAAALVISGTAYEAEATYYHPSLAGGIMKNGERYDPNAFIAASNRHPLGTVCKITNRSNGRSVVVTIADRGGGIGGNVDLSRAAFQRLADLRTGRIDVLVEEIER